ncbi:hypothetical protein KAI68_08585, partial [bacterium]|nr:hypothetical protein [bacterium]
CIKNNFIGINKSILEIKDEKIRNIVTIVAFMHELRHEATGKNDDVFEEEQLEKDVVLTLNLLREESILLNDFIRTLEPLIEKSEYLSLLNDILPEFEKYRSKRIIKNTDIFNKEKVIKIIKGIEKTINENPYVSFTVGGKELTVKLKKDKWRILERFIERFVFPSMDDVNDFPELLQIKSDELRPDGYIPDDGSFGTIFLKVMIVNKVPILMFVEIQSTLKFRRMKSSSKRQEYSVWKIKVIEKIIKAAEEQGVKTFYAATTKVVKDYYNGKGVWISTFNLKNDYNRVFNKDKNWKKKEVYVFDHFDDEIMKRMEVWSYQDIKEEKIVPGHKEISLLLAMTIGSIIA